jgi:hypothetical protein
MRKESYLERLYIYSKERFSLWQYIPLSLIMAGVLAVGTQVYLNQKNYIVPMLSGTTALFLFFLRLRIFDEFKDYDHDLKYYSHRPVPRGVISKKELKNLLLPIIISEFIIAFTSGKNGSILFIISFIYSLLMLKEFYVCDWIKARFTIYVIAHEILLFPLFFYICAISGFKLSFLTNYFFWFLITFTGLFLFLLEVARKIRPANQENDSKDSYTAQYGIKNASLLLLLISILAILFLQNSLRILGIDSSLPSFFPFLFFIFLSWRLYEFNRKPSLENSKKVFMSSICFAFISCIVAIILFIK